MLRERYAGKAEYVVNFFQFIAEEVRELLAELGFRTLDEAIGHAEVLDTRRPSSTGRLPASTSQPVLHVPVLPDGAARHQTVQQDHGLDSALDNELIELCRPAIDPGEPVRARTRDPQRQPHGRHDARPRGDEGAPGRPGRTS